MSKYTTELRYICETASGLKGSVGYNSINDVIDSAIPKVFSFDFPIFDEKYRNVLCGKILKHYYTREICEETVGLWKLRLDTRMNEIMPYYNQLYKSELLQFNPMYDIDLTRKSERVNDSVESDEYNSDRTNTGSSETDITNNGTNSSSVNETTESTDNGTNTSSSVVTTQDSNNSTTTSTSSTTTEDKSTTTTDETNTNTSETSTSANGSINKVERDLYSDTPQGGLIGVETEEYLTNARKKTGDETNSQTGSTNGESETVVNGKVDASVEGSSNTEINNSTDNSASGVSETEINGSNTNTINGTKDVLTSGETSNTGKSTTNRTDTDVFNSKQDKSANTTEEYLETVSGKQGGVSYSKLLMEYRNTFLNIDMQVINDLADLFFGLW